MSTLIMDNLDNANNGVGQTIDVAAMLGNGVAINPHGTVVAESTVTAGAVAFQSGVVGATGIIAWTTQGTVSLVAGAGATIPQPGSCAYARIIVTTPIVGGKATAVVSV